MDSHAQKEIRDFAEAMYALLEPIVPVTLEAFRDYELGSIRLTKLEIEAIRGMKLAAAAAATGRGEVDSSNSREQREWTEKRRVLGL